MLSSLLVAVLLTGVVSADSNNMMCPTGCQCYRSPTGSQLAISCSQNISVINPYQLSQEVGYLLSADHIAQRLEVLAITDTPMTQVPASVCQLTNLTHLYLDRNKLTSLPDRCLSNLTNLEVLQAVGNAITSLQDGLFDALEHLQLLNFEQNHISEIGLHVFSNASSLTCLQYIHLCCNRLTSLEPWWYYRAIASKADSPVYVMLHGNLISNFTNKMGFDFHCGMKAPYGYLDLTDNRVAHVSDAFLGWNVDSKKEYLCLRNFSKSIVPRMHFYFAVVSNWTFTCDCVDFWLYERVKSVPQDHILDGVYCNSVDGSGQLVDVVSVPLNEFVCNLTNRCPSRCRCAYRPENDTLHVYCSATNQTELLYHMPPLPNSQTGYKLDFSKNKLSPFLQYRAYFVNTSVLDLSDCGIEEIDEPAWNALAWIGQVYLQGNKLHSVPPVVVKSNGSLYLGNNPWACSCGNRDLNGWFMSIKGRLLDPESVHCETPARLRGKSISEMSGEDFCADPVQQIRITVGTLGSLSALILIAISVFAAAYRSRVRVYKRWKFHPFDRDECTGEDMEYDVFFCCSSEDTRLHGQRILQLLESKGYRVCYHLRDFMPGEAIADNMCQAIVHSKRTVCLLSKGFLRSTYCMTEFDMAFHHNVAVKRKKRLIVLMMLDSPSDLSANDASDTATLRHHVRQYTYIDYTADDWLDKLLYALPLRGLLQASQDTSDDIQLVPQTPDRERY